MHLYKNTYISLSADRIGVARGPSSSGPVFYTGKNKSNIFCFTEGKTNENTVCCPGTNK